jgi:outer membrane biosynthesis protein TonB
MFWAALREDLARWYAAVAEKVRHFRTPAALKVLPRQAAGIPGGGSLLLGEMDEGWYVAQRSLLICFGVSLLLHLTAFGTYRIGKHWGWWDYQATWLSRWAQKARPSALVENLQKLLDKKPKEIPLTFVDVDPATAAEPPKNPQYYSVVDTQAANPEPEKITDKPKIDGKQDKVPLLADNPKPKAEPLQPAPPPQRETQPGDTDKGAISVLDSAPRTRPRTYAEAVQRNPRLAGEQMRQAGGVSRRGRVALDVKATPFGAYDAAFIAAVQQCWYDLIDSSRLAPRTGKVVVEFRLNYDGRITDLKVTESEVGDMLSLLCQEAIRKPAPFPRWPSDMWRAMGKNHREVLFTFYYN